MSLNKAYAESDVAVIVVEPTGVTQFIEYSHKHADLEVFSVYINNDLATLVERLVRRYEADQSASAAYYWLRLQGTVQQFHEWPHYIDWSLYVDSMDDNADSCNTVKSVADTILGTSVR